MTSSDAIQEDVNTVYIICNASNSILGYKDHGKELKLEEWNSLKNFTDS